MDELLGFKIVDLSVCLSEGFPLTWPGLPPCQKRVLNWYEPLLGPHRQPFAASIGAFYAQSICLDEHTGTHVDYPSHNIPPSSSRLPNAGDAGDSSGECYPIQNLWGPTDVFDLRSMLDRASPGVRGSA
jgi:kynurenine formamidase